MPNSYISKVHTILNAIPKGAVLFLLIYIALEICIYYTAGIVVRERRDFLAYEKQARLGHFDIVALGDSATESGIDTLLLSNILSDSSRSGNGVKAFNLGAGTLKPGVGYYIFKNIIIPKKPEVVLIGFHQGSLFGDSLWDAGDAYHTLRDYVTLYDLPSALIQGFKKPEERADFILRKFSSAYNYRYIINEGIIRIIRKVVYEHKSPFGIILDKEKDMLTTQEARGFRPWSYFQTRKSESVNPKSRAEYAAGDSVKPQISSGQKLYYFKKIIETAKANNIRLVAVAMPIRGGYHIPDSVYNVLKENDIQLVDFSKSSKFEAFFADREHLSGEGARILTKDIAGQIKIHK